MRKRNRLVLASAAAGALAFAGAHLLRAGMTGGSLSLSNTSTNGGGGTMGGGGFSMSFGMGGPGTNMGGAGFTLQPGAIGAASVASANLDQAHAFPTPFKPSLGHDRITFSNLTAQAVITIYNLAGERVKTLSKNDALTDQLVWMPVANESGVALASGVYVFTISSPGHLIKKGKLMIIK